MQRAAATPRPGKACLEDIYDDDGDSGQAPQGERKNDGSRGAGRVTVGKKPLWGPVSDTHLRGPHSKPRGCPRGTAEMSSGMSWGASTEAGPPRFSARPFPPRGAQRAQQSGVLGLLSSLARKFHLISCLVSLPLNQWNFPSLSFSQTKVAHAEGEDAETVRCSVGAQGRGPMRPLGGSARHSTASP